VESCEIKIMKKIIYTSIITVLISIVFMSLESGFGYMFGFISLFVGGITLVLIQDKDKSYDYLFGFLGGSLLLAFLYSFLVLSFASRIDIYTKDIIMGIWFPLVLSSAGGLIGLLIRGTRLVAEGEIKKRRINKKV